MGYGVLWLCPKYMVYLSCMIGLFVGFAFIVYF